MNCRDGSACPVSEMMCYLDPDTVDLIQTTLIRTLANLNELRLHVCAFTTTGCRSGYPHPANAARLSSSHMLCHVHWGGFPTICHNEVRDITAGLIKQVAHQVTIEPHLQPLSGEHLWHSTANTEDPTHLDVAASGIWGQRFDRTLIDIMVFDPYAASNRSTSLATCYAKHEKEKKRTYEQ